MDDIETSLKLYPKLQLHQEKFLYLFFKSNSGVMFKKKEILNSLVLFEHHLKHSPCSESERKVHAEENLGTNI